MKRLLPILALALAGPAAAAEPFRWEVPNVVEMFDVQGKLEALGIPVTLHVAAAKMPLPDLLDFYARAFRKAGLVVDPAPREAAGYITLTALDPDRLVTYTVLLHQFKDGTTRVVMGSADHAHRRKIVAGEAFAPVAPGATDLVTADVEYGQTMAYTTAASPEQLRSFYAQALPQVGYTPGPAADVFERGNEELSLFVREENGRRRVVVRTHHFGAMPTVGER